MDIRPPLYITPSETHANVSESHGSVEKTLMQRKNVHGLFSHNADLSQTLKRMVKHHAAAADVNLSNVQLEAIDNICQKLSRIASGDPNHLDHWHDIAGYATLAERITGGEPR